MNETPQCEKCSKPPHLCLCGSLTPQGTTHQVVILQHPQEPDKVLGTAHLAKEALENASLHIGLSWPNFGKVLGRTPENKRWGVLYLGSAKEVPGSTRPLHVLSKKGNPHPDEEKILKELEGFVVLDGTWSQAKALWWRNAWLLKLHRLVLFPEAPSLYGKLRREPRRESVSTIESIALTLSALGEPKEVSDYLIHVFSLLLKNYRGK